MPRCTCRGRGTTCNGQFSPSTLRGLGLELELSDLGNKYLHPLGNLTSPVFTIARQQSRYTPVRLIFYVTFYLHNLFMKLFSFVFIHIQLKNYSFLGLTLLNFMNIISIIISFHTFSILVSFICSCEKKFPTNRKKRKRKMRMW